MRRATEAPGPEPTAYLPSTNRTGLPAASPRATLLKTSVCAGSSAASGSFVALERALNADGDVDEFTKLVSYVPLMASAPDASQCLARCFTIVDKPYANVGIAALRLLSTLARQLGDESNSTRAIVQAAEKEPDDDVLVSQADEAVRSLRDGALSVLPFQR